MKLAKLNNKPEIFYSIQGEGKNIGKPSIFIRLSLCNLYCTWCDTDYTWNWEKTNFSHNNDVNSDYKKFVKKDFIINLKNKEIFNIINKINCNNYVITGGEPMVQHKELLGFLRELKIENRLCHVEMETNGTLVPNKELDALINQFNVSLKLSNSKVNEKERIIDKSISYFSNSKKSNFKFVVDTKDDLNEILLLKKKFEIQNDKIYLMPQGTKVASLKEKQLWLIEICKEYEFNYTDRLHIHIYGDKRGV